MNLYSDLPPANESTQVPIITNSNSNKSKIINPNVNSNTSTVKKDENLVHGSTNNKSYSLAFKPASLAFKPRQTVTSVNNNPTIKTVFSSSNMSSVSNEKTNDTIAITNKENTTGKEFLSNNMTEEFNLNSSFEVYNSYDPGQPNDYIMYCTERLERKKQRLLEEENKKHMEDMIKSRDQVEKERKIAAESGDILSMINSIQNNNSNNISVSIDNNNTYKSARIDLNAVGRGRGRLANLPAWMTEELAQNNQDEQQTISTSKQQLGGLLEQSNINIEPNANVPKPKLSKGSFSKPSCVLLLKNMIGIEEQYESDGFADEVRLECLKYGPIGDCIVYMVDKVINCPDEERIRTFVSFERQESAVKAFRDLNGRFFGGRQVIASFYDEKKFNQGDFIPLENEFH